MPNLVEKVNIFFVGTSTEIKEKVGNVVGTSLYFAEMGTFGYFVMELIRDGRFDAYTAPFALDGLIRFTHNATRLTRKIINKYGGYTFRPYTFEFPGIIGSIREAYYSTHRR